MRLVLKYSNVFPLFYAVLENPIEKLNHSSGGQGRFGWQMGQLGCRSYDKRKTVASDGRIIT